MTDNVESTQPYTKPMRHSTSVGVLKRMLKRRLNTLQTVKGEDIHNVVTMEARALERALLEMGKSS